jgi:predicted CXXCH cytochrome family protein
MKNAKTLIKLAALTALLAVPVVTQGASIVGSAHDLRSGGPSAWKGTNDQTCVYCHTPHNGLSTLIPLWNHPTTATASFTLYPSGGTLNATPGQPTGASRACLSCHDGTLAADSFGTSTGTHPLTGPALLGTDLSNDHPISFTYDATLVTADTASNGGVVGLVSPSSASLVVAGIPLFSGKLECASCHNVHDPANGSFLRVNNAQSALCLKCHIK